MQGFIVTDHIADFPHARQEITQWLAEGKIKRKETILKGGLKVAEEGLVGLFKGINTGTFSFSFSFLFFLYLPFFFFFFYRKIIQKLI